MLWTGYLLFVIVLIGAPGTAATNPLFLLGRMMRSVEIYAGRLCRYLIHFMFSLNVWIRMQVLLSVPRAVGRSNVPWIFVANHRSNLDVFFLISHIPNIRIMAKRSLFYVPYLGFMMWLMRQIPVTRGEFASYLSAVEDARRALRRGDPVHIFPEGKRCSPGFVGTQKFYPAAFSLAKEENVPVQPLVFVGSDRVWPRGKARMKAWQTVKVLSLEPMRPDDFPSAEAMMRECQRRINQALETHS